MMNPKLYHVIGVYDENKVSVVSYVRLTESGVTHTRKDKLASKFYDHKQAEVLADNLNQLPHKPANIKYITVIRFEKRR